MNKKMNEVETNNIINNVINKIINLLKKGKNNIDNANIKGLVNILSTSKSRDYLVNKVNSILADSEDSDSIYKSNTEEINAKITEMGLKDTYYSMLLAPAYGEANELFQRYLDGKMDSTDMDADKARTLYQEYIGLVNDIFTAIRAEFKTARDGIYETKIYENWDVDTRILSIDTFMKLGNIQLINAFALDGLDNANKNYENFDNIDYLNANIAIILVNYILVKYLGLGAYIIVRDKVLPADLAELDKLINEFMDSFAMGDIEFRTDIENNYVNIFNKDGGGGDTIKGSLSGQVLGNETAAGNDGTFAANVKITGDAGTFHVEDKAKATIGTDDALVDGTELAVTRTGLSKDASPYKWNINDSTGKSVKSGSFSISKDGEVSVTAEVTDPTPVDETVVGSGGSFTAKVTITNDDGTFNIVTKGTTTTLGTDDSLTDGTEASINRTGIPAGDYTWSVIDTGSNVIKTGDFTINAAAVTVTAEYTDEDIGDESAVSANDATYGVNVKIIGDTGTFHVEDKAGTLVGTDDALVDGTVLAATRTGLGADNNSYAWKILDSKGAEVKTGTFDVTVAAA